MNTNPLKDGVLTDHSVGIGRITRRMVRERAIELAVIDGRPTSETSKSDWERAKSELAATAEMRPNEAAQEAAPESARWDLVPGSAGRQAAESASEDEDDDGRSDQTQLVNEGMAGAEKDSVLRAAQAAGAGNT